MEPAGEGAIEDGARQAIEERHGESKVAEALKRDAEELLLADEFEGYRERPVGETIARLCKVLGLAPDRCVRTEAGWMIATVLFPLCEYAKAAAAHPVNGAGEPPLAPSATGPPN